MPGVLLSFLVTKLMINYKMFFLVITKARVTCDISITLKSYSFSVIHLSFICGQYFINYNILNGTNKLLE